MSAFADHVTSVGFSLTLSKRMLELLAVVHEYGGNSGSILCREHFSSSLAALLRRGLIQCNVNRIDEDDDLWILTPQGNAITELLIRDGIAACPKGSKRSMKLIAEENAGAA